MFETTLSQVSDDTRAIVRQYLNTLDQKCEIIDTAYSLYMPQIRSEIEELYSFVENHYGFTAKSAKYNILEIGTKFGGTFYLWNSINKSGLNISVDFSDGGLHGGISDEEMNKRDLWFNERFDNCKFIRGDSHSPTTMADLQFMLEPSLGYMMVNSDYSTDDIRDAVRQIDFLFIDGDHTYDGVHRDFLDFSPLVKNGGLIVFHDITDSRRHRDRNVNVAQFWNEIKNDYEHYEIVHPDTDDVDQRWAGLGILVKK